MSIINKVKYALDYNALRVLSGVKVRHTIPMHKRFGWLV